MADDTLTRFIERTRAGWGPFSSEGVHAVLQNLTELTSAPPHERWLAALHEDAPASAELHRDPEHGFILLAHSEQSGLYRPPHDHGRAWVVYALQRGEMETRTYARVLGPDNRVRLVNRDVTILRAGDARVYLPGDIHDTRCLSGPSLLFRFTERDLKKEDLEAHQVARYLEHNGVWTVGTA